MLPRIPYSDTIRRRGLDEFRGINRNPFSGDGIIVDCRNMSGRFYPAASTRPYRYKIDVSSKMDPAYTAVYSHVYEDKLYSLAFNMTGDLPARLYCTDLSAAELQPVVAAEFKDRLYTDVSFTVMGNYLVIFPMGAVYDMANGGELMYINAVYQANNGMITYSDGTYGGIDAAANTVTTTGDPFPFNVGDCVTFEGTQILANRISAVIQEMNEDKTVMRFLENTFTWPETIGSSFIEPQAITISRVMPEELEHVMCVNNRLWACGGKRIAASADGDPFNWNTFEGTDADSWQVDELSGGDFTACTNYGGVPVFFKSGAIVKVLGDYPSTFRLSVTEGRGVKPGAAGTLAEAGGYLFYLSNIGMMYYSGGIPRPIGAELGDIHLSGGTAGSDGRRYYISFNDGSAGSAEFYSYDTETGLWYREDSLYLSSFSGTDILYGCDNYGDLVTIGNPPPDLIPSAAVKESDFASSVTFTDFVWSTTEKKRATKLQLRLRVAAGASVQIKIRYNSEEEFTVAHTVTGEGRTVARYISVVPHRCDHFTLKLDGQGEWQLAYIAVEAAIGSAK